jgi:hypothetical protein
MRSIGAVIEDMDFVRWRTEQWRKEPVAAFVAL